MRGTLAIEYDFCNEPGSITVRFDPHGDELIALVKCNAHGTTWNSYRRETKLAYSTWYHQPDKNRAGMAFPDFSCSTVFIRFNHTASDTPIATIRRRLGKQLHAAGWDTKGRYWYCPDCVAGRS